MENSNRKKKFAIMGVGGFVAERHVSAIRELGHDLVASYDITDSVGYLDHYFPKSYFFTSFERFDRFLEKQRTLNRPVDYLVVCTPNHLHDAHIRYGLKSDMEVICEKPLVINPFNLRSLEALSSSHQRAVSTILQLRLHPEAIRLKEKVKQNPNEFWEGELTYIAPRGNWYHASWKGQEDKSGGVMTNIGIHFFDLLLFIFGDLQEVKLVQREFDRASGIFYFKNARISWYLSVAAHKIEGQSESFESIRTFVVGDDQFDFTYGFEDLHLESYSNILKGKHYGMDKARKGIELCYHLRQQELAPIDEYAHPSVYLPTKKHPFV